MRKPKYTIKQMRYFRSMSTHRKVRDYWTNRLYRQAKKQAIKAGDFARAEVYEKSRKKALAYSKRGGMFHRQHWTIASEKDMLDLAINGKMSADGSKLLILDDSNSAVIIAYAGTELFDEAVEAKRQILGE